MHGTLPNGTVVAVKRFLDKTEITASDFRNEVECMAEAKHTNIVRLLGYCFDGQMERVNREKRLEVLETPNATLHRIYA